MLKRWTAMAAGVLIAAAACGGGDSTSPNGVTGTYTLRSVNGIKVPAVAFQSLTEKDEVTGGSITLNSDRSWSAALNVRVTELQSGGSATFSAPFNGTYTTSGTSITITEASTGSHLGGTIGGGALTLAGDIGFGSTTSLEFTK